MDLQIKSNAINKIDTSRFAIHHALTDEPCAERHSPPSFSLDTFGFIRSCGSSIERIFGYSRHELEWQHISCLFSKFSEVSLMLDERLNPLLSYLCHCDHVFEAIDKHGDIISCKLNIFVIENNGMPSMRLIVRPVANAS
jgi:hypothetical protein